VNNGISCFDHNAVVERLLFIKKRMPQVSKGTLAMTQYLSSQAKHNLIKITEPVFGSVVVL